MPDTPPAGAGARAGAAAWSLGGARRRSCVGCSSSCSVGSRRRSEPESASGSAVQLEIKPGTGTQAHRAAA